MLPSQQEFYLWSVWDSLSVIYKTFLVLFIGVTVYSLSVSAYVLSILQSLKKTGSEQAHKVIRLASFRKHLWNLRQLHLLTLYLFGFCIVVQIPGAFHTIANSKDMPYLEIMGTLTFLFYFDAVIFAVFIFIHAVQWFASARLYSKAQPHFD